jgi:hypothetical protein
MRNKTRTKRKLEDLDRYIAPCKYCNQDVSSQQSFVAFASKDYAHYDCMKADDERRNNGIERSSYQTTSG